MCAKNEDNSRANAASPSFFEKIARKSTVFLVFSSFFDQKRGKNGKITGFRGQAELARANFEKFEEK